MIMHAVQVAYDAKAVNAIASWVDYGNNAANFRKGLRMSEHDYERELKLMRHRRELPVDVTLFSCR